MSDRRLAASGGGKKRKVAVIGAGLGGMAAAIDLAVAGLEVVVLEKNERVGGKVNVMESDGFVWDTGPSLLTMPDILRELWSAAGRNLDDYLDLVRMESACRYRWQDGTEINANAAFWERPEVARFLRYARGLYDVSAGVFLRNPPDEWKSQLTLRNLPKLRHLPKIFSTRSMHAKVRRFFKDPHLVQVFDRFANLNGSSPFEIPSAFNAIAFMEAQFGSWYVRGGMYAIARAFERLALELGVRIVRNAEVTAIRRLPAGYALDSSGGVCAASSIVCNADALTAARHFLGWKRQEELDARLATEPLSMSGFIMMLGVRGRTPGLAHHNVFFSRDSRTEFRQLFEDRVPADEPTIYVTADCLSDPGRAPEECENWFVLVNAPPLDGSFEWSREASGYGNRILAQLGAYGIPGLRDRIVVRHDFTPADMEARYHAYAGSIHGFASHGLKAALRRPAMEVEEMPGVFLAGGSTHPGGGIPLVVESGRMAARKVQSFLEKAAPELSFGRRTH